MPRRWIRSGGQAGDAAPDLVGLVVVSKTVTQTVSGSKPSCRRSWEPVTSSQAKRDRLLLEVVAEGEVAVHLEERRVPRGLADLLDVEGAHALLHAGRPRPRRGLLGQ